jgi:hypothetical protein
VNPTRKNRVWVSCLSLAAPLSLESRSPCLFPATAVEPSTMSGTPHLGRAAARFGRFQFFSLSVDLPLSLTASQPPSLSLRPLRPLRAAAFRLVTASGPHGTICFCWTAGEWRVRSFVHLPRPRSVSLRRFTVSRFQSSLFRNQKVWLIF